MDGDVEELRKTFLTMVKDSRIDEKLDVSAFATGVTTRVLWVVFNAIEQEIREPGMSEEESAQGDLENNVNNFAQRGSQWNYTYAELKRIAEDGLIKKTMSPQLIESTFDCIEAHAINTNKFQELWCELEQGVDRDAISTCQKVAISTYQKHIFSAPDFLQWGLYSMLPLTFAFVVAKSWNYKHVSTTVGSVLPMVANYLTKLHSGVSNHMRKALFCDGDLLPLGESSKRKAEDLSCTEVVSPDDGHCAIGALTVSEAIMTALWGTPRKGKDRPNIGVWAFEEMWNTMKTNFTELLNEKSRKHSEIRTDYAKTLLKARVNEILCQKKEPTRKQAILRCMKGEFEFKKAGTIMNRLVERMFAEVQVLMQTVLGTANIILTRTLEYLTMNKKGGFLKMYTMLGEVHIPKFVSKGFVSVGQSRDKLQTPLDCIVLSMLLQAVKWSHQVSFDAMFNALRDMKDDPDAPPPGCEKYKDIGKINEKLINSLFPAHLN